MKKKTPLLLILLLICALIAAGCTTRASYTMVEGVEQNEENNWKFSYISFDGYIERSFSLSGERDHTFVLVVETEGGQLSVFVSDASGNEYFGETDIALSSSTFILPAGGRYTVRVEGIAHSGGFSLFWD